MHTRHSAGAGRVRLGLGKSDRTRRTPTVARSTESGGIPVCTLAAHPHAVVKRRPSHKITSDYGTRSKSPLRSRSPSPANLNGICRNRGTYVTRSKTPPMDMSPTQAPMTGPTPGPLFTFGVEMEVLVHVDPNRYRSRLPSALRQSSEQMIAVALSDPRQAYEALIRRDIITTLRRARCGVNELLLYGDSTTLEDNAKWSVSTDDSISAELELVSAAGNEAVIGVEIKTPVLSFDDSGLAELTRVINLLNRHYKISSNRSCALHVHVGIADSVTSEQMPITVDLCHDLTILSLTFEKELEALCSPVLLQGYTRPLSRVFDIETAPDRPKPTLAAMVACVRAHPRLQQFCRMWHRGREARQYSINFQNLRDEARLGTIEFRQHAGCFDVESICNRVRFVVQLMRWCEQHGEDLDHLIWLKDVQEQMGVKVDVLALMRLVGVGADVIEFYSGRLFVH